MRIIGLQCQKTRVKAAQSTLSTPFAKLTINVYDVHAKSTAKIVSIQSQTGTDIAGMMKTVLPHMELKKIQTSVLNQCAGTKPTLANAHFANVIAFLLRLMLNYQPFTTMTIRETLIKTIQTAAQLAPVQLICNVATMLTSLLRSSSTTRTKCNAVPMYRFKNLVNSVEIF